MLKQTQFIYIFLFAVFLVGCAGSKRVSMPASDTGRVKDFDLMKEDFDPVALKDDDIEIKQPEVTTGDEKDVYNYSSSVAHDTVGIGYRIQIVQTTDPEEAKEVMRDAILKFDHEVYRIFDAPHYKVRIGNFVNWNDAEKVQEIAIKKGFRESWVIRTKIDLRKAYNSLDQY